VLVKEYLDLPLPLPHIDSDIAREIISLHDSLCVEPYREKFETIKKLIDEKIFTLFELTDFERELVQDTTLYTVNFFQEKDKSLASAPANADMISEYCVRIQNTIANLLNGKESLPAKIFMGSRNFIIVSFSLNTEKSIEHILEIKTTTSDIEKVLLTLRNVMTEKISDKVYFVRKLKIYEKQTIYIVKPNERRYWTRATAYEDADGIVADILEAWRERS
jgi:hypothetical protein